MKIEPAVTITVDAHTMNQSIFNRAAKCLIDNGTDSDEAATVLQALCYILMDTETELLMDQCDMPIKEKT